MRHSKKDKKAIFWYDKPEHAAQHMSTFKVLALYVERECKIGEDIRQIFRKLKAVQVVLPTKLTPDTDKFAQVIWQEEYKEKREKLRRFEENKSKAFALSLGKCSPNIINKLEGQPGYKKIKETRDLLGLLKPIQAICCKFESNTNPY